MSTAPRGSASGERKIAILLRAIRLEAVHRDLLRALYPKVAYQRRADGSRHNNQNARFRHALHNLEARGYIRRDGPLIHVTNQYGINGHALGSNEELMDLALGECLLAAQSALDNGAKGVDRELWQQEVAAIRAAVGLVPQ